MSESMNRRDAIRSVGLLSFATALDVTPPQLERAFHAMAALAGSQAPTAENQPSSYAPKFFTSPEWRLVRMLSDYVIPKDARSGSATDAKVPEYMDFLLSDREASESSKVAMRGGLAWINQESRERFGVPFVSASDAQRRQILDDIAWPAKARPDVSQGVAFFTRFRDLTASGFFSSQAGWDDLRYIGNMALPSWDGCPPAALQKLGVNYDLMDHRANK